MKNQSYICWIAGLLVGAVVLPTVCLLWFMGQAVGNVQLAMRQQLADAYQQKIDGLHQIAMATLEGQLRNYGGGASPENLYYYVASTDRPCADTAIVMDSNWSVIFPIVETNETVLKSDLLEKALLAETANDCNGANCLYKQTLEKEADGYARELAAVGAMRCSFKLGDEAGARRFAFLAGVLPYSQKQRLSPAAARLAGFARLFEFEHFIVGKGPGGVKRSIFELVDYPTNTNKYIPMPLAARIFYTQRILDIAKKTGEDKAEPRRVEQIQRILNSLKLAETILAENPDLIEFKTWSLNVVRRWGQYYAAVQPAGDKNVICVFSKEALAEVFRPAYMHAASMFNETAWRIVDEQGKVVAGADQVSGSPFLKSQFAANVPGWQIEIYLKDKSIFEWESRRKTAMYVWVGMLVIAMMAFMAVAGGSILVQQARVNRLKNDFLATVSHELRTPLASMRLMLDTVLEGRYSGEGKAKEYLELAAKENERLTRLIENFLSFSKMARNKKSFDIRPASAEEIASEAAEAVKNKYEQHGCDFEMTIARDVPPVMADKDAIVTVLVNLLDNACKYTGTEKQIRLNVFYNDGGVYFQVADNGIGMGRRALRKIFDKFYQVDQSLARKAEGCGLGLSIVKFIVEAHKGKIEVESKSGKGSTFTIRLEIA